MNYISVNADVDIDDILDEIDTDDLIDELKRRGYDYGTYGANGNEMRNLLEKIWLNRRNGQDYQADLDKLIYGILGKVV